MGSYDGAETTDLVGLFLLNQLKHLPIDLGLYRDDGLAASALINRLTEMWQQIKQVYEDNGLKVTAEVNKKVVNFLDVTLNLNTGTYRPYRKPNTNLLYISSLSNHPPTILKNIPLEVNRRLCRLSSTKEDFMAVVEPYQEALDRAGYEHQLLYQEPEPEAPPPPKRKSRSRRVTWFNPPFSQSISTNIGKRFLSLIDSCFPPDHELRRVVNRNTVKVSYSTMPNMAQEVNQHNAKISRGEQIEKSGGCNGHRGGEACPVPGDCMAKGVVYSAEITDTSTGEKETYTGLTEGTIRDRISKHLGKCRHRHQPGTRLSAHVWKLKDRGAPYTITWKILSRASTFNTTTGMCRLCLKEKYLIMFAPATASLNKRSEIYSSCRHRASKLLAKV